MWGGKSSTFLQGNTDPRSGQVYTMYHGTSMEAAKKIKKEGFRQSDNGMLGRGVYLSRDLEKACRYPLNLCAYQRVVLKVKVEVGKVKKIDRQFHPLQDTWHDHGYDTAWCPPKCGMVPSGLEEDCVWDPKRIQSDKGMLGPGVYLSRDLKKDSRYPLDLPVSQRVIVRVEVDVGKVIKIDYKRHPLQETWHDYGYDTAWCPPNCGMVRSGLEEFCVWDPERITVIDVIHPIQEEIIEQDACRTL